MLSTSNDSDQPQLPAIVALTLESLIAVRVRVELPVQSSERIRELVPRQAIVLWRQLKCSHLTRVVAGVSKSDSCTICGVVIVYVKALWPAVDVCADAEPAVLFQ